MELVTKLAWGLLAALHVAPALALVNPPLIDKLYGVPPEGDVGILLTHRGALFGAVVVAALFGLIHIESRKLASIVAAISMTTFLYVYWRAGFPPGALRPIALADAAGMAPLLFVLWRAWR